MAHIADLYNNGRCGQLRTIESARGAYSDLIRKEAKSVDSALRRSVISSLGITCPRCALPVSTARCSNCCYFPVKLPSAAEIDQLVAARKQRDKGAGVSSHLPPPRAANSAAGHCRDGASSGCPQAAAVENRPADERRGTRTPSRSDRIERLQSLVSVERQQRIAMLERVKTLSAMVERLDARVH